MHSLLLVAAMLGQSDKLGDPAPRVTVKLGDPFEARPLPASWRVRRATAQAKPAPLPGRSVPERLDTLEYSVAQLKIDEPKEWKPKPGPAAEPPATQVKAPPKAAMPPPDAADLGVVLERLDAIEDKLTTILARVEASAVRATAPPAAARTDNAPARMPAAATPPPLPAAPRTVVTDRWVPVNRVASTPYVAQPYFAPAATYSFPLATYGGFGGQAPCVGSNCGQPQGLFGGLIGGRFR
jgi:hypothetical protein